MANTPAPYGIESIQELVKKYTGRHDWLKGGAIHPAEQIKLVVMHATAGGSLEGAVRTLLEKGFSYNYIIDRDGKIFKCVSRAAREAYHSGNSYGPREEALGVSIKQNSVSKFIAKCKVGDYSVGISFVNRDDGVQKITRAQWESALWLVAQLKTQFPNLTWVSTHAHVSPRRKVDPLGFALEEFSEATQLKPWRNISGVPVKEEPSPQRPIPAPQISGSLIPVTKTVADVKTSGATINKSSKLSPAKAKAKKQG